MKEPRLSFIIIALCDYIAFHLRGEDRYAWGGAWDAYNFTAIGVDLSNVSVGCETRVYGEERRKVTHYAMMPPSMVEFYDIRIIE